MRIQLLLISAAVFFSCSREKKTEHGISLSSSERVYGAICIDETLSDTLVSFSVDLVSDEAEIRLSDKIDLGFSVFYEQEEDKKIYNMYISKLEKNISGRFTTTLKTGALFAPLEMQKEIVQNFSNSVLIARFNPDSTIYTTDDSGCGDMLERGIFEMSWFPEFNSHSYTIIEYYQDSKESWVNVYRK